VISTVVTGPDRGAIAVQDLRLQEWVDSVTGLVALGGLIFGCGLPAWAIVRWVFNFIEKNRDVGIDEVAREVKEVVWGVQASAKATRMLASFTAAEDAGVRSHVAVLSFHAKKRSCSALKLTRRGMALCWFPTPGRSCTG